MKAITSVLFFFAALCASAQTDDYYTASKPKTKLEDRISGSVTAGTGITFWGNSKNTAVSTFIAPKFNYKVSEKFYLTAGLMHYTLGPNNYYPISNSESLINHSNRNSSGNLVLAGAEYQLNKKVIVSGAFMTDVNSIRNTKDNYKALSLGMDYKVSPHSSIGLRATVSQGSSDYMFDPNRGTYNYNPTQNTFGNVFSGLGQWSAEELNRVR